MENLHEERMAELEARLLTLRGILLNAEISIKATIMYTEQKQHIRAEAWQDAILQNLKQIYALIDKELRK